MERYELTLQFDNDSHTLTAYDGLTIHEVGELLSALASAMNLTDKNKVTLSEISGNCYALRFSTQSHVVRDRMIEIHDNISRGDFAGFTKPEKDYTQKLQTILRERYYMRVYDKEKKHLIKIAEIKLPKPPEFYYEIGNIYGCIVGIGSKSLNDPAHIKVDTSSYNIYISAAQENELIHHYKKNRLKLSVKLQFNFETDKVRSAELLSYEVMAENTFFQTAERLRNSHTEGLFLEEIDPLKILTELRENE